MALSLVVGPAHAGKVALLLDRYVDALDRVPHADPWLVVPNRMDVERVERDLLRRRAALLAGRIGTFDDLFEHVVRDDFERRAVASDIQRTLAIRRAIERASLDGLAESSGSEGFADSLLVALGEVESALVEPEALGGDLGRLSLAYREELDRLGLWDRDRLRRRAAELLGSDFASWDDEPVFAYGFEDLTAAEWALLEALSARTDVTVSIPYEAGRVAFASLERTVDDLAGLARGAIEELGPALLAGREHVSASLLHLERQLFTDEPQTGPPVDGALRFLEGAGARGTAELVAAELLELLRSGVRAERVGLVCDSVDRWRATLDTVFAPLGIPYAIEQRARLGETAFGRALLGLLRFAWRGGRRGDLFRYLRSPFSGLERRSVDFVEGRLRGRAIAEPERIDEETERLRGAPLPALDRLREGDEPVDAVRELVAGMARNAWGLESPPTTEDARADARALQAILRTLDELDAFAMRDGSPATREDVVSVLERTTVRPVAAGEAGRVAVLDYRRARTRELDVVVLLGLEEGSFPRRDRPSPFLDDEVRRELGGRLERVDPVARDRYLLYTACTRARRRLVLAREAATDDGVPREPSPFWDDVQALFDPGEVARATQRRPLSSLTWPLEGAPSDRERLRATARLAAEDGEAATALASANGWTRRLERALAAFERPTELESPGVLEWLGQRTVFAATELERFADCSSAWLVERVVDPKRIDAEPDPILRGQVVHTALNRFYSTLPKALGAERVTPGNLEAALDHVRRCLDDSLESGVRLDLTPLQQAELRQTLLSDLEGFVRDEAVSQVAFEPRRLEVSFGSDRAAPELQRGLSLGDGLSLSGKIDRIDVDPFSARGIVQDYKSGAGAHSARDIDRELRLQIPLYVLVLRDLVGVEPLGGVYRALSGRRVTRGMLRASARDDLPGFARDDYLEDDAFWEQVGTARERAAEYAQRIRAGDVRHDPKGDGCPSWCDLWTICRVPRA
jgi:ATP-dependent helicase/DNAse subunit B